MRIDGGAATHRGRANAVQEIARRMRQHEEEWKDKCAAMGELRALLGAFDRVYAKISATEEPEKENSPEPRAVPPEIALFSPENVQQLTQPFRETLSDLRSAVVREACTTLSELARIVGPDRCKLLVRDVFPTLMSARGTSNKVNTSAVHRCIEDLIQTAPSRHVLAPILQALGSSKNREVRESCMHYARVALELWQRHMLEPFKQQLQTAISAGLSDASPKGRETARICYWKYIAIWPDQTDRFDSSLSRSVKKHLKRARKDAGHAVAAQPMKRRHLVSITNTLDVSNHSLVFEGRGSGGQSAGSARRHTDFAKLTPVNKGEGTGMAWNSTPDCATSSAGFATPVNRESPSFGTVSPRSASGTPGLQKPRELTPVQNEEFVNLQRSFSTLEADHAALEDKLRAKDDEINMLKEQLRMKSEDHASVLAQLNSTTQVVSPDPQMDSEETCSHNHDQEIAELKSALTETADALAASKVEVLVLLSEKDSRMELLESEVGTLQAKLAQAEAALATATARTGDLKQSQSEPEPEDPPVDALRDATNAAKDPVIPSESAQDSPDVVGALRKWMSDARKHTRRRVKAHT